MTQRTCTIDGCDRKHIAKGFCTLHYRRWQKHGDPLYEVARPTECVIDGCDKKPYGYGWCQAHYTKWRKYGDPLEQRYGLPPKPCKIAGCDKDGTEGRGMCYLHYRRYWRHGDPLTTSRIVGDDEARFWSYVDKDGPNGCWEWTGDKSVDGYGVLRIDRRTAYMPRWSYELHVEPIAPGLEPDHLCRNRGCVNPDHLEPVTHRVNILRGESPMAINARKTHCIRGHEFTPENTKTLSGGGRGCITCKRAYDRNRHAA